MKIAFVFGFVTLYGLSLHILFGFLNGIMGIMSLSFLGLVPFCAGYLTVSLSSREKIKSAWSAFFLPWVTSLVFLLVSVLLAVEGVICWIMIYPFFATAAGIGGLMARFYILSRDRKNNNESAPLDDWSDWDSKDKLQTSLLMVLPLLMGAIEGDRSLRTLSSSVTCFVDVDATPAQVWPLLVRMPAILPQDTRGLLTGTLDFPRHLYTTLDTAAVGGHRTAMYERGLVFEEIITTYEPQRRMVLDIHTDPAKIPPTVLDEHVMVGGRYFYGLEDTYELIDLPNGRTRILLTGRYTLNTPMNWYCDIWVKWLVRETLDGTLGVVKGRL